MAFSIKEWKDRISEYANRRKLTDTQTSTEQIVTVARYEGNVTQEGDAFSAANMNDLEQRIADALQDIEDNFSSLRSSLSAVATSGSYTDLSNKPTIPPAVAVKGNAETSYRTGNVNLTPANIGAATSTHVHGNIANNGTLSANAAIQNGDRLVIRDVSDSNKITSSNTTFGTSTATYLRNDGAWGTPAGNFKGINQGSTLVNATWGSNTTYTWSATGDGWLVIRAENNTIDYYINNVKIGGVGNYEYSQPIPIKSGQSIKAINSDNRVTNNRFTVYAVN